MMPRRIADIVEIIMLAARAHAFLRRYRGAVRALLQPREDILERHHARVDEHQRRVVIRHQRRRRLDMVPRSPEIVEEGAANVVGRYHARELRSEERSVGKGCGSSCRSWWSPIHKKKK